MSRRRKKLGLSRDIQGDPVFGDVTLSRFVNKVMEDGKKQKALSIVYKTFDKIKESEGLDPLEIFKKALENCKPSLEVRSRRVGGATYQVPVDVRPARRLALAMRWLVSNARAKKNKNFHIGLAEELIDAYHNRGNSIKKKEDVHRMAESNRAFSHYNW